MTENGRKRPQFSVIIPTFNRGLYVQRAINSVLRQNLNNCEIIVVDDGSTDGTPAILKNYGGRIRAIQQQNAGASAARNAGIASATGDWVAFLDSDDEWRPGYLERQNRSIKAYPRAVVHIVNAVTIYADGSTQDHFESGLLRRFRGNEKLFLERPFLTIINHCHWYLQALVVRREILLRTGLFKPHLTIAEDLDLIARLSLTGPFVLARETLVETYRRQESLTPLSLQKELQGVHTCELFNEVYEALSQNDSLTLREQAALAEALSANKRAMGNFLMREGNFARARDCYRSALAAWPSARSLLRYLLSFAPN
jgi:glycosyltransferase involved in cell wall biosynthesis